MRAALVVTLLLAMVIVFIVPMGRFDDTIGLIVRYGFLAVFGLFLVWSIFLQKRFGHSTPADRDGNFLSDKTGY